MDDALVQYNCYKQYYHLYCVLILVVMDDALVQFYCIV